MCKHNHRAAGRLSLEVRFEPLQLVGPQFAEPFECGHVREADEVDVFVIETIPSAAFGVFSVTFQVHLAIVERCVMLAGHEEGLLGLCAFQDLIEGVKFARLGCVAQIACVNNEVGLLWQGVDLIDRRLERTGDVGIRGLVEAHVAVADLDEVEFPLRRNHLLADSLRRQYAAANGPDDAGSSPSHTFQETAAVNTVVVVVVNDSFRQVSPRVDGLSCSTGIQTRIGESLFHRALKIFFLSTGNKGYRRAVLSGVARCGHPVSQPPCTAYTLTALGTARLSTRHRRRCCSRAAVLKEPRIPDETHPEISCSRDGSAYHRIRAHSSLWTSQGPALTRTSLDGRRSKLRRHQDPRTILRQLPLGSHGVAVVQLCSSSIMADRERRAQWP